MADAKQPQVFDPAKLDDTQLYVAEVLTKKLLSEGLNPDLFVPLAFHESGLRPNAIGPEIERGPFKGQRAQGLFQYMPAVAKERGIDDPLNFEQNMNGAIKDFKAHMQNPKIGLDASKLLSAWNAGPNNDYIKTGDLEKLPDETVNYLIKMHSSTGGNLPTPVVESTGKSPEAPPSPSIPSTTLTPTEAITAGTAGATAGAKVGAGVQAGLGTKYALDYYLNQNSPASLQRYSNSQLGDKYLNVPLKELENLTNRTIVAPHDVQEAIKDVHGRPIYPKTVRVESGAGYKQMPVVDPIAQKVIPTGMSTPIDISKYEVKPGMLGAAQKTTQAALPVLKSATRVAGSALGGAGAALDVADALKRARSGDVTGSVISGTGAGLGTLGTLGAMGLLAPEIAVPAAVGALGMSGINAARDIYKMSPDERQQLIDRTKKNLMPSTGSGGNEALFNAIANQ
jgi:hypothetical protein